MEQSAEPGVTARLADLVRELRFEALPADAVESAKHCLLDWLGCTLAGSREPLAGILMREVAASDRTEEATVIGQQRRASALTAALLNGATSHALDFDDTHSSMGGHPSVPVVPAALALAERERRSGRDLLVAVVAGIELECRLGALLDPQHYAAGFHNTGTVGTLGAAAAAAHLLGLDRDGWLHALGLAGTQAAGLKSAFGTMAKPLHAGKAAYNGLLSALLARSGFTGNPRVVEVEQGMAETLSGRPLRLEVLERYPLAGPNAHFLIRDTLFKYHAACYLTHSAIEGAREIRARLGVDASTIRQVDIQVAPASLRVCNIERPTTGLEGKFSLRATTAMALLGDDTADLEVYERGRMTAPDLVAMRERVRVVPIEGTSPTCSTVIAHAGGQEHRATVDVGKPAADLAEQWQRLVAKFERLAAPSLPAGGIELLRDLVARLEELDSIGDLFVSNR